MVSLNLHKEYLNMVTFKTLFVVPIKI